MIHDVRQSTVDHRLTDFTAARTTENPEWGRSAPLPPIRNPGGIIMSKTGRSLVALTLGGFVTFAGGITPANAAGAEVDTESSEHHFCGPLYTHAGPIPGLEECTTTRDNTVNVSTPLGIDIMRDSSYVSYNFGSTGRKVGYISSYRELLISRSGNLVVYSNTDSDGGWGDTYEYCETTDRLHSTNGEVKIDTTDSHCFPNPHGH